MIIKKFKYLNIFICILLYTAISSCSKEPIYSSNTTKDSINIVSDSSHKEKRDTITLPGSIIERQIPCPDSLLHSIIENKGGTHLSITNTKGGFKINCKADSLIHIIDSLKDRISTTKTEIKTVTITLPPVKEKFIPFWIYLIIGSMIVVILGMGLKIIFRV